MPGTSSHSLYIQCSCRVTTYNGIASVHVISGAQHVRLMDLVNMPHPLQGAPTSPPLTARVAVTRLTPCVRRQCSVSCGWGSRRRLVTCPAGVGRCPEATRPRQVAPCRRPGCAGAELPAADAQAAADEGWMVTEWAEEVSARAQAGGISMVVSRGGILHFTFALLWQRTVAYTRHM